jgi:hypothetical protein
MFQIQNKQLHKFEQIKLYKVLTILTNLVEMNFQPTQIAKSQVELKELLLKKVNICKSLKIYDLDNIWSFIFLDLKFGFYDQNLSNSKFMSKLNDNQLTEYNKISFIRGFIIEKLNIE